MLRTEGRLSRHRSGALVGKKPDPPNRVGTSFSGRSNNTTTATQAHFTGMEMVRLMPPHISHTHRRIRVPSRLQPWDNAHNTEGGLDGIGFDGRPIVPERFRPREPFLVVAAEEVHRFGTEGRVEKPHGRADCGPARRRREIQAGKNGREPSRLAVS